jgi:hypothetical protein
MSRNDASLTKPRTEPGRRHQRRIDPAAPFRRDAVASGANTSASTTCGPMK